MEAKKARRICLPPAWCQHGHFMTMALLALHMMPPGAWLLLFIYQWIDIFFRITMVCHSFWVYLLKGNYFPKSSGALILSQSASLNIASLSLPEWVMIWDSYSINHFHYQWKTKRKCSQWNQWMTISGYSHFVSKGYNKFHVHFVSWQLLLDSASVAHQFMPLIIPSIKNLF